MIIKDEKIAAFASTADEAEISRFNKLAEEWWKPKGAFKVVHAFNAARVEKLSKSLPLLTGQNCDATRPLEGLSLLDVGCGAGIVSEPIAKLGADITAIDASERNVLIARQHAEKTGVKIEYKHALPEEIASSGQQFDIVTSLEVIEHVADPGVFLNILARLVKPGGILVIGTLNRTPVSYIKAIIGAEHIMRWLPKGTHDWKKFVKPKEMDQELVPLGFSVEESCGVDLNPFKGDWRITENLSSIYMRFYRLNRF